MGIRGSFYVFSNVNDVLVRDRLFPFGGRSIFKKIVAEAFASESAGAFAAFAFPHTEEDHIVTGLLFGVFAIDAASGVIGGGNTGFT